MSCTITHLIEEDAIRKRVKELASSIDATMKDRPFVLLVLMKGALPFATMLKNYLSSSPELKTVKVSSYSGMKNTGSVKWKGDCGDFLPDVPVLVIDDVLDSGATLSEVCKELSRRGVQEVQTAVAVDKHCCRKIPFEADYVAFTLEDDFLVGFGMDLDERYRDLPFIGKVTLD